MYVEGVEIWPVFNAKFQKEVRERRQAQKRVAALEESRRERERKIREEREARALVAQRIKEAKQREYEEAAMQSHQLSELYTDKLRIEREIVGIGKASRFSTYRRLELTACLVFGLSRDELLGRSRKVPIVFARQFLMYWAARRTQLSLANLGKLMGRDHTSVISGVRSYRKKRAGMGRNLRPAR